ncbi:uncharacterized protein MONBRDRAFT_24731 [Monosiga brevicollis MX1]|uniref:phosphopyruvate hydratase n=1 Tax=Monosiga brevicollis TaxID=81824 RepID=A9UXB0_MONBE|nr:uncharacterized protein MONBRDRAFT_24731 [Monosiga brevicollis MX1]EDQ90358.1 predicted protein [Monosiga brevicollis MX1]|eukprot:XP_001745125.1 hypothetical protein [Monosiga brevicollis MX1]
MTERQVAAEAWIAASQVLNPVEDALNAACKEEPEDVIGFLAEYFRTRGHGATIDHVEAVSTIGNNGMPQLGCRLFARVNNVRLRHGRSGKAHTLLKQMYPCICHLLAAAHFADSPYSPKQTTEDNETRRITVPVAPATPVERLDLTEDANVLGPVCTTLNEAISPAVYGLQLENIEGIDDAMLALDADPLALPSLGVQPVLATSLATVQALAEVKREPVHRVLSQIFDRPEDGTHRGVPIPLIELFQCTGGKARLRSVYVRMARQLPMKNMVPMLLQLTKAVQAKAGTKQPLLPNDNGIFSMNFDSLDKVVDLLRDAGNTVNMQLGRDFYFGLSFAVNQSYDSKKDRYDIGTSKTGRELADELARLTHSHGLVFIVDPLRAVPEERENWQHLCTTAHGRCHIVCHQALESRPSRIPSLFGIDDSEADEPASSEAGTPEPAPEVTVAEEDASVEASEEQEATDDAVLSADAAAILAGQDSSTHAQQNTCVTGVLLNLVQCAVISNFCRQAREAQKARCDVVVDVALGGPNDEPLSADLATAIMAKQLICPLPLGAGAQVFRRLQEIEFELESQGLLLNQGTVATGMVQPAFKAKAPRSAARSPRVTSAAS